MNMETYRKIIDDINLKILELINKRAFIAVQIGKEKEKYNIPVTDSQRENSIFETLKDNNKGPLSTEAVTNIFNIIIQENKALEVPKSL